MDKAAGSYAFGDSEFEDKMERKTKALKPVRKPDGFVIPGVVWNKTYWYLVHKISGDTDSVNS